MRSQPDVLEHAVPWYEAFCDLTSSRLAGLSGALPIPLTEIEAYCRIVETPPRERAAFLRLMRRIDLGYLDLLDKQKTALEHRKTFEPPEDVRG